MPSTKLTIHKTGCVYVGPAYEARLNHLFGKNCKLTKGLVAFIAYATLDFCAAAMVIVFGLTVKALIAGRLPILEMIELAVVFFFLSFFWGTIFMMAVHIRFEQEGLWIRWPFRKPELLL